MQANARLNFGRAMPTLPRAMPVVADSVSQVEQYRPAIQRYVLKLVGDADLAEDLTQETLLRAYQRVANLEDPGALQSWLYRIATNVCYDAFRQRHHRPADVSLSGLAESAADIVLPDETRLLPDQLLEQHAMSDCITQFLTRLPEAERTVLLLHDLQGFTDPEIADQVQSSLPTVKIRLHRARVRLRKAMHAACDFTQDQRGTMVCHPKIPCG